MRRPGIMSRNVRSLRLESLEARRCLAASLGWDGPGQGLANLSYYISPIPSSLDATAVTGAIESALQAWSDVADVNFVKTSAPGQRNSLDFSFTNLDGPGGALAQAYLPADVNPARIAGDVQFDSSESWEVGNTRGNQAFDLTLVAAHEIGHALGLDHASVLGAVMYPSVSAAQQFTSLSSNDVSAILALYAAENSASNGDGSTSTPDDSIPPETPAAPTSPTRPNRFPWHWSGRGRFGRRGAEASESVVVEVLQSTPSHRHNHARPTDVNVDGLITPFDALLIINELNKLAGRVDSVGAEELSTLSDCNGDGSITALDALLVFNRLNASNVAVTETVDTMTDPGTVDTADDSSNSDMPDDGTAQADDPSVTESDDESPVEPDSGVVDSDDDSSTDDSDTDDSGTEVDCGGGLQKGSERFASIVDRVFSFFDVDDDGTLNEGEMGSALWQRLSTADADSNGTISSDELLTILATTQESLPHRHGRHGEWRSKP